MSVHLDVRSESLARTSPEKSVAEESVREELVPIPPPPHVIPPPRRTTIFERQDIMQGVSPAMIAAIQKELVEMREDFDQKILSLQRMHERQVSDILILAASERVDIERMKCRHNDSWETASESSSKSP